MPLSLKQENLIPRIEFLFQSLFRGQASCVHCLSNNTQVVVRKYLTLKIRKCSNCHLFFTDPIYRPFISSNLYETLYRGGAVTNIPAPQILEELKKGNFSGVGKDFSLQLNLIRNLLRGNSLLEIGSSWGYFLYQAHKFFSDVDGIEISEKRRVYANEFLGTRTHSSFSDLNHKSYDGIFSYHTLEHFTDLRTIFSDIFLSLKEGGKLFVEVPNFDFDQFGASRLNIIGAVHPLGFSSRFFKQNLPRYGFKNVQVYESWDKVPDRPVDYSASEVIVVLAEK